VTVERDLGLRIVVDEWLVRDTPDLSAYVAGLPDASGEFTGTFDQAAAAAYLPEPADLFPVEISTGDGAAPPLVPGGSVLTVTIGKAVFEFGVHHAEIAGPGRSRIWCFQPGRESRR
jgi:hypothetical protein